MKPRPNAEASDDGANSAFGQRVASFDPPHDFGTL